MSTSTEAYLQKTDLHNWIMLNRETYHLFEIKIAGDFNELNRHNLLHMQQANINRLVIEKKKAIETYLYLTDQNAEGDTGVILDHILILNQHLKQLLCL